MNNIKCGLYGNHILAFLLSVQNPCIAQSGQYRIFNEQIKLVLIEVRILSPYVTPRLAAHMKFCSSSASIL